MPPLASIQSLTVLLHFCRKEGHFSHALALHSFICDIGLGCQASIGNYLVPVLVASGAMCHAQQVFDVIEHRDSRTWNSLIIGYVKNCQPHCAFTLYRRMQKEENLHPTAVLYVSLIKTCADLKDADRGHEIHAEICKHGVFDKDIFVCSALVSMFVKCGCLSKAQLVFKMQSDRDVVLWNALISGLVEHQHTEEAVHCFDSMRSEGIYPDEVTFLCVSRACSSIGATVKGQELHIEIVKQGLESKRLLGNTIVDMYAKFGFLIEAHHIFFQLPFRDMVGWTSLIAGYAEFEHGIDALQLLDQMQQEAASPDGVTYVFGLKACSSIRSLHKGKELHSRIIREDLLQKDIFVVSTLLGMYAKCGSLITAKDIFDKITTRDVVSWNVLMVGYVEHGFNEEALICFQQLQNEGHSPDAVTIICCLKACGCTQMMVEGQLKHADIVKMGLEDEFLIKNTLIDMYAKCGLLAEAQNVFDKLAVRNAIGWTALISGYVEHECPEEALYHLKNMYSRGIFPIDSTFLAGLKACGSIGATIKGQELHIMITIKGLELETSSIGNTLVDMYAKSGSLAEAQHCFDKLRVHSVISWTALITGYAQIGKNENVFWIFERMIEEGVKPNFITLLSLLTACSHTGLLEKGQLYFRAIINDYEIVPTLEHFACMIDLLGRAGHIEKATAIVEKMPYQPMVFVWHTILGACQKWGDTRYGQRAFEHAIQLDTMDATTYICMSNIYTEF